MSGAHREALGGSYYLDVISPCRAWLIEAVTRVAPRGSASAQPQAQETALAIARTGPGFGLLAAARAQLAGPASGTPGAAGTSQRPKTRATSVETARIGLTQRVASLRNYVAQLRVQFGALSGAAASVNPTSSDYNPQTLNVVNTTLNSTAVQLRSLMATLAAQPVAPPFGHPVRRLVAADRRMQEVAAGLSTSIADLQAGRSGAAASVLASATVALHRADNALKRAQVLLIGICSSAC